METKIDFVISAARYRRGNRKATAIIVDSVKQHRLYGNSIVGQGEVVSRQQVISNLGVGMIYYTAIFNNGRFVLKNKIAKYSFPEGDFMRADGEKTRGDNLGDLPTL